MKTGKKLFSGYLDNAGSKTLGLGMAGFLFLHDSFSQANLANLLPEQSQREDTVELKFDLREIPTDGFMAINSGVVNSQPPEDATDLSISEAEYAVRAVD